jgi:hypothetical protein
VKIPVRLWEPKYGSGPLPYKAQQILKEAAQAPPEVRRMAIDAAIERVKLMYPQYFKEE